MPPGAAAIKLPTVDEFEKQVNAVGSTFTLLRTVRAPGITIPAGIRKTMVAFAKAQAWWKQHRQLYMALTEAATGSAKPVSLKKSRAAA